MRITLLLILIACLEICPSFAQKDPFESFFKGEGLGAATWSVYAIDANTGRIVAASPQKSLTTASVTKLLTTAVALEMLGPDYTFATTLYHTGNLDSSTGTLNGDLILKGGCDPAFYSSWYADHYKDCFESWVVRLQEYGIKRINGKLLLDLSAYTQSPVPGGWAWDDIGNYYGAGVSALSFADNQYEIHLGSSKTAGEKATILAMNPIIPGLTLENRVFSSYRNGDHTIIYGAPGSTRQYIEGTIPVGQEDFVVKAAMPDPSLVAGELLLRKIREQGISIQGHPAKLPADSLPKRTLLSIRLSPPLKELIVPLNKESLNVYAEQLLREIGRRDGGDPDIANGVEAIRKYCKDKGIDGAGLFVADGSGLSRSNACTARTLVETMKHMWDGNLRIPFFNSLPVAGVDGTLKNTFKDTPLEKNLHAKTGSMSRVRNIAGTMKTKGNKTLLVAILINNFDPATADPSKLLESILLSLYAEAL